MAFQKGFGQRRGVSVLMVFSFNISCIGPRETEIKLTRQMLFCTEKIRTCSGVSRVNLKEGQSDTRFAVSFIFITRTRDFTVFSITVDRQNMQVGSIVLVACSLF